MTGHRNRVCILSKVKQFLWQLCRSYGNKWWIIFVVTVNTYWLAALICRHRYVCTDHANERSRKLRVKAEASRFTVNREAQKHAVDWVQRDGTSRALVPPGRSRLRIYDGTHSNAFHGRGWWKHYFFYSPILSPSFWPENPFSSFVILFQVIFWLEKERFHKILRGFLLFRTLVSRTS